MNTLSFLTRWIGQVDGVTASVHKSLKGQAKSPHVQAGSTSRASASAFCFVAWYRRPLRGRSTPLVPLFNLSKNYCRFSVFFSFARDASWCRVSRAIDAHSCDGKAIITRDMRHRRCRLYILQFSRYFHRGWKFRSTWYNNGYALRHP